MSRTSTVARFAAAAALLATLATVASSLTSPRSGAASNLARCEPGDTELLVGAGGAGLGHWGVTMVLVDPGARHCVFMGYPRVRLYVNSTKRWVAARATPAGYLGGLASGQHVQRVVLNVENVASFMIEGTDVPVGRARSYPSYVRLEVALPGWPISANLPFQGTACAVPQVHPLVLGPTGDQPPT